MPRARFHHERVGGKSDLAEVQVQSFGSEVAGGAGEKGTRWEAADDPVDKESIDSGGGIGSRTWEPAQSTWARGGQTQ